MSDFAVLRAAMVDGQIRPNNVSDPRLLAVLRSVPRDHFVPKALRSLAYIDEDLEIAGGRFLLEPMVFARLAEAAEIGLTDLVLDIGCATGYSSAIFGQLGSAVVAVEADEDLAHIAEENLTALEIGNVAVVNAPHQDGYAKDAPYDVIFINGAIEFVPDALARQLADEGRLVCVMMKNGVGRGVVGVKTGDVIGYREIMDAHVPTLPGFKREAGFSF